MLQGLYVHNDLIPNLQIVIRVFGIMRHRRGYFLGILCSRRLLTAPSSRINDDVIVRLKWGQTEYKGRLISVDSYMNIQLSGTEEYIDGKNTGSLGQVLIRYVRSGFKPCMCYRLARRRTDIYRCTTGATTCCGFQLRRVLR